VRWRPFLLGPILAAQGLTTSPFNVHAAKGDYMWRDVARICTALGLPFRRPDPFPQASLLAARIALVGLEEGWGERFVPAVYRAQFADGLPIAERTVVADLLHVLDVDPGPVLARAQSEEIKGRLRTETDAAAKLGILALQASSPPGASCSGATIASRRRSTGLRTSRCGYCLPAPTDAVARHAPAARPAIAQ